MKCRGVDLSDTKATGLTSFTLLGSGTSTGVPIPGCQCEVCQSTNERNKRMRTSILITTAHNQNIIIDTGPDLRTQLLANNITNIDAAIITHDHADHVHGIDDLRPFCFLHKKEIPVYTHHDCANSMRSRFPYIFKEDFFNKDKPHIGGGVPRLKLNEVDKLPSHNMVLDEEFYFSLLPHGYTHTMAVIYKKLAILVDCHEIPDDLIEKLKEIELEYLIIDCVKEGSHQTHLTLDKSFEYIKRINAKKSILVHMGHELEHQSLEEKCMRDFGKSVFPGYDSMQLSF